MPVAQGCQIFLGTRYRNGEKYTKRPQNIPNGYKIIPKFTQIGIFGLKTNHLATLLWRAIGAGSWGLIIGVRLG
jgi:hypothetical protein